MSLSEFVTLFLRHGPNVILYPGAFDPHPRVLHAPSKWNLDYEDLTLITEDKVKIHAYLLQVKKMKRDSRLSVPFVRESLSKNEESCPVIIMFHGNSDNIGFTIPLAKKFYQDFHCNVLMLSPRGYGKSGGTPSTKGFQRDADTALQYILSHPDLSKSRIILYGQSMGGAMAIDLAGRKSDKISALIVENTFTSLCSLIPDVMPSCTLVAPFFRQWNSKRTLERLPYSITILMLSGENDEVIPPVHMHQLWKAACGPRKNSAGPPGLKKRNTKDGKSPDSTPNSNTKESLTEEIIERKGKFVSFPNRRHNNTCEDKNYWKTIREFLET